MLVSGSDRVALMSGEPFAAHPVVRTGDVEDARAVLERVLPRVPVRLRMANGGDREPAMRMNALDVGAVTVSYIHSSVEMQIVHSKTANYHVNVPLSGRTRWRYSSGVVHTSPEFGIVQGPGVAGEGLWEAECAQLCIMLSPASLESELERHLGRPLPTPLKFSPRMVLGSAAIGGWLDALRLVCRAAEPYHEPAIHPLIARTLESLLVDSLLLAQPHNYTVELQASASAGSPRAVRQAIELLREMPGHSWTVGELAERVNLSVRALQRAFIRAVGVPPMRYLRQLRLTQVHEELLAAHPADVTVTEVAHRWGFPHPGRFTSAYREMFGEVPTQTLRAHGTLG